MNGGLSKHDEARSLLPTGCRRDALSRRMTVEHGLASRTLGNLDCAA